MSDTIPNLPPQKQCLTCKKTLPATTEYFHAHKEGKYGLRPHCKDCRSAIERAKVVTKQEVLPGSYKKCAKCLRELPATDEFFHRNKRKRDGFHQQCKDCKNTSLNAYRLRPGIKEYTQSYSKRYQSRPEVKERIRLYQRTPQSQKRIRAYLSRPEVQEQRRILAKNYRNRPEIREHEQARRKAYTSRPEVQDRHRMHEHNRRTHKRATHGTYTVEQIHEQYKRQKGKCYYCHKKLTKYHIDHVIPLSRKGTNDISNLVVACPFCNLSKGDKLPYEWPQGGRLF